MNCPQCALNSFEFLIDDRKDHHPSMSAPTYKQLVPFAAYWEHLPFRDTTLPTGCVPARSDDAAVRNRVCGWRWE